MSRPKVVKCRNIIGALKMPEASYSFTASETYEPETNQLPSLAIFRIAALYKSTLTCTKAIDRI